MLAADINLVDIDAAHWANWFELLVPPILRLEPRWAVLFTEREQLTGAMILAPGTGVDPARALAALDPAGVPFTGTSQTALARLCGALDVDTVVVVDRRVLDEAWAELERSLSAGDDLVAQGITLVRVLKKHNGRGIWSQPNLLELVPPMAYEPLQRTFDLLVPNDTSMVAYVMEDDGSDVHASLIAVKRAGHVDLVATHLGIDDALAGPVLARSWRRDHKRLLALVAQRYAPPSLAVLLERQTFYRVMTGPTDQLARELNARNVIIDPAPAWLLGLLGGATMAAFASRGAKALARILPSQARKMAADLAQTAQTVMRDSGAHPFALLGFDPIELWLKVRHLYERRP